MMSISWKSYLFAVFVVTLVHRINAEPPEDIKIISTSGSTNRTRTLGLADSDIYVEFQLHSTLGNTYQVSDASLPKGKWWIGSKSSIVTTEQMNAATFTNLLTVGAIQTIGTNEGVDGSFTIRNDKGNVVIKMDFKRKEGEQVTILSSNEVTCQKQKLNTEWTYAVNCD